MTTQHTEYLLIKQHQDPKRKPIHWAAMLYKRLSVLYGGSRTQNDLPLFLRFHTPRIRIPEWYQDREVEEAGFERAEKEQ
jgi:hypothetical protein